MLAQVSINGEIVTNEDYTVEKLSELDTATVGKKEVRLKSVVIIKIGIIFH